MTRGPRRRFIPSNDSTGSEAKLGPVRGLIRSLTSWRTAAVALLSFSSGLPLGLVWYSIPDWMRDIGVDIRIVGLFTLAQAPWAFKVVWSPLMDRYVPPFWGRRRGWMAVTQLALFVLGLFLAGVGDHPEAIWVVGALALAIALASASFDVAYDAYAVDVLHTEEQGAAVGARVALYRAAMMVAGGAAITLAGRFGWGAVNALLALVYLPMIALTWKAPEPERDYPPPPTLRDAVWQPFIGFLARPRALEILAFVLLYKFADQLAQALTRPFLIDMGYNADHRGVALSTVGMVATIAGAFLGGWVTTLAGLGHSLWLFGGLQVFSNVGYFLLAGAGMSLPMMYGATSFELFTSGLGTGAFGVLLLRITQKRFSATQYALFTSLFALPRLLAGPITGFVVDAIGWRIFFLSTMVMGIPGLVMLYRFVPFGTREPHFEVEHTETHAGGKPVSTLVLRGVVGGAIAGGVALLLTAVLAALKLLRESPERGFDLVAATSSLLEPQVVTDWVQLAGIVAFAVIGGTFTAAVAAARR